MSKPIHVISLGAGVQSSTMALMAAHGEIEPMPAFAIFADTQWEPRAVYSWLDWLDRQLPFPVVRVTAGNIRQDTLDATGEVKYRNGAGRTTLPFFVAGGVALRKCTKEYKIEPIERYLRRETLGLAKGQRGPTTPAIIQWRGISIDEASRMKPATAKWYATRFPLAMEHRMSRADCLAWMERRGYPLPPRSACLGCPFHSDHEWRKLRDEAPEEWALTVEFDQKIRFAAGMNKPTYLHRSCVPLDEADIDGAEGAGQLSMFANECEGMCGL